VELPVASHGAFYKDFRKKSTPSLTLPLKGEGIKKGLTKARAFRDDNKNAFCNKFLESFV